MELLDQIKEKNIKMNLKRNGLVIIILIFTLVLISIPAVSSAAVNGNSTADGSNGTNINVTKIVSQKQTANAETSNPVLYVSTNGDDANGDGTQGSPYATIQKALDRNKDLGGDYKLLVSEGHYYVEDYYITANFTIKGNGTVIIDGNNKRHFSFSASYVKYAKLEGLTFINGNGNAGSIHTASISGGNGNAGRYLIINNCNFINNRGSYGAVIYTTMITTINGTSFINNTATQASAYSGVINAQDNNLTVTYSNFIDNKATSGTGLNGIYAKDGVNVVADYNFWGTNNKPGNSTISSGINVIKWVILNITPNSTENINLGSIIDFAIDFTKYTDGINNYTLSEIMPEITINATSSLGSFNSDSIKINTTGSMIYTAEDVGSESINFNIPSNIKQFNFTVGSQYSGTVYVSKTGSDSNNGSQDSPVASISKAIEIATAQGGSKKIVVLEGTYNEGKLTVDSNLEITTNGTVIINGNDSDQIFDIVSGNVSLKGLTLNANSSKGAIVVSGGNLSVTFSTINNKKTNLAINNSGTLDINYSNLNRTIITNNGAVTANYNWWGTNNKPTCVNVDNWVVMTINLAKVYTSEISNLIIKLNTVTDGVNYTNLLKPLPNNYVILNVTSGSGTLNATNVLLENGVAYVSFNGGENAGLIQAKIDGQIFDIVVEKAVYKWFIDNKGYRTLQQAVDAANINDVIKGVGGVYVVDSEVDVGHRYMPIEPWEIIKKITVTSLDKNNPTIISGNHLTRLFNIDKGSSLTLINLILANGNATTSYFAGYAGAIHVQFDANLTIENCTFENNTAGEAGAIQSWGNLIIKNSTFRNNTATSSYGGAIQNSGYGSLIIDNSTFINNSANTYAGAIYADSISGSNTTITNTKFLYNNANRGGALFLNMAPAYITNCSFIGNQAINKGTGYIASGGAIYDHSATLILKNSEFINNTAENNGGALELANTYTTIYSGGNVTTEIDWFVIENCTFWNNTAKGDGGAIFAGYDSVPYGNITSSIFENNTAVSGNGGAICNYFGILTIKNTTFTNNIAGENGGVIFNYGDYNFPYEYWGNVTIDNCNFSKNSAKLGGTVYNSNEYSKVDINNSKFSNEHAESGGAIYNNGTLSVNGSEFTNNSAAKEGGAIYNTSSDPTTVSFSSFVNNTAPNGSAIYSKNGTVNAKNNWWGSNSNPSNQINGTVDYSKWLYMTVKVNPTKTGQGGAVNVTVSFNNVYDGTTVTSIDPINGHIPDGTPVNFSSLLGTFNHAAAVTSDGIATTIFTVANYGNGSINATTNNQTVSAAMVVDWPVPTAGFTTNPTKGTASLPVRFTDASTGNITGWDWDFNNDGVIDSNLQNPTWTYTTPGTYTVTLTVTGPGGNNTTTQTVTVNWPAPVAGFTVNPTHGIAPLPVRFTGVSTGNITGWDWDFNNDGVIDSNLQNPTWTYTTPGTYTVTLTVTGPGGNNTKTLSIKVSPETIPPQITKVDPANGTTNVAASKTIKVTFNEAIKKGNLWIELLNSSKKAVPFKATISGNVLTIKPTGKLAESKYTLIIHTGAVTDLAGNPVALKSTKFSTGTSPNIAKIDPVNGATNVAADKAIKVTFGEAIKKGNLWIELVNASKKAVPFKATVSGKTLTIKPTGKLAESLYTLVIHTGAVTDLAGNPVALKSTKFSTGTSPNVAKIDPVNGATNVAADKAIKVTFGEAIKKGNLWIELLNSSKKAVPFKATVSGKTLTIKPTGKLAESKYTLIIHTGAVTDLAGNPVALKSTKFSTGTSPKITKIDPKNRTINIPRNKAIKVTFNEAIKKGSLKIELLNSSTKVTPFKATISGKTLTIKPTTPLKANTKYKLIIHTKSVTDLAGNPVKLKNTIFTTGT